MIASRRSILALIGMAPVAAPVAAKEAASKMGLASVTMPDPDGGVSGLYAPGPSADTNWARRALRALNGDYKREEHQMQARNEARTLDADLAALRSMSPSVAYSIQRGRSFTRIRRREKSWLEHQIKGSDL